MGYAAGMSAEQPLDEREERAWRAYHRMNAQLAQRIGRELAAETGLSDADIEIMLALSDVPGNTLRALALRCSVHWEKSRLSHHIARMERRGLVAREDCAEDARGAIIRLTTEGREAIAGACCVRARAIRTYLLDRLTDVQVDALIELSAAVLDEPDHADHDRPARTAR